MIYSTVEAIEAAIVEVFGPKIGEYLTDPTVKELAANYDPATKLCRLYVDDGGDAMRLVGVLSPDAIVTVTLLLATGADKPLDARAPFLNCVLPSGCRYHAALNPVADGPSVSIRMHHPREWSLPDFMTPEQAAIIEQAVIDKLTILVAGGTFTGKTSLLNAIISLIPDDERLIAIEDELELRFRGSQHVTRRRATEAADLRRQVIESLRDRPDRIIVGEVRGAETAAMLEALVTGHGGGLTTIHAKGTEEAITRMMRLAQCDRSLIDEAIDLIVQLERKGNQRKVREIKRL